MKLISNSDTKVIIQINLLLHNNQFNDIIPSTQKERRDTNELSRKSKQKTLDYFKMLESNFPKWLNDYINTKEMLHQQHISVTCGTIYTDLFNSHYFFSSLDHSIAVALIIWHFTHQLSIIYREDRTRDSMQFIADILKKLKEEKAISIQDLYILKEKDIIDIIEKSQYSDVFNIWKKSKKVKVSNQEPENVYFVHHGAKVRYIDPLVNKKRISNISKEAKEMIENNLKYDMSKYVYLDLNLN